MLHKINLIESFKEYLIGLKVSRYKVNLDPTYFLDLCFHLTVLLFVLGFHSFAFAHRLAHTVTTLIHTHSYYTVTHAFYIHTCQTATSLTRSPQYEDFALFHWCVCDNCNKSLQCLDVVVGKLASQLVSKFIVLYCSILLFLYSQSVSQLVSQLVS